MFKRTINSCKRGRKMSKYYIVYKSEIVDEFDSKAEANEVVHEYNMAFMGGCSVRREVTSRQLKEWYGTSDIAAGPHLS